MSRPKPKKRPKSLAVIDEDGCTGCEACIYYCPVPNCIIKIPGLEFPSVNPVCRVVDQLCIGCGACVRPCPWDTIAMVPLPQLPLDQEMSHHQAGTA